MTKLSLPGAWNDLQLAGQLPTGPLWLLDRQSKRVCFNYRSEPLAWQQQSLSDWLYSLDASCRLAVRDTIERVSLGHEHSLRCYFCHDDECWYRLNFAELEHNGMLLLYGYVSSMRGDATVPDMLHAKTEIGALSCPDFRTLLIQALRSNALNGEPLTLLSLRIDPASPFSREQLAEVLSQKMRRSDQLGLFRQHELLILLNGAISKEHISQIAQKVAQSSMELAQNDGERWLKIGWVYYPSQGENVDTLLERRYSQRFES